MAKTQLDFTASADLLEAYGIPILGKMVTDPQQAVQVARDLGYPVVLKAISEKIIHKTDAQVVFLNLKTEEAVKNALDRLMENVKQAGAGLPDGILVQKMADPGFELLVGAKQDPGFGPVTMVGHGGRFVELWADVQPGIGILTETDVEEMLSQTMAGTVLNGFRGPALDKPAVIRLAINVSRFMADHPEINELDLNPVIVYEQGYAIVDCRLIADDPITVPSGTDLSEEKMKSLKAVFSPRSVAIVGASRPGTMGGIILKNCLGIPTVYPINPKLKTVQGLTCYPDFDALPEAPDLGVFAVNAEATVESFERFCKAGGRGAIIFSDGFAEIGRKDLEERLLELSIQYDVAYIGPNCMGVIDNFSKVNTLFIPEHRTSVIRGSSGIGIISQSGGVGLELMEMMEADNLDLGMWVSCGNASSVGVAEILAHMGNDPRIKVIAIYMEGFDNGLKLMQVGKTVSAKKPVLVIKGGTGGGAAATLSHTASLAGSHEAFKACCRQAGFYLVEELTEDPKVLVNILSMLSSQPAAGGNRVAVVSVGGGAGILLADRVTEECMELAEFAPETRKALQDLMADNIKTARPEDKATIVAGIGSNPLDLFGNCDDDRLLAALRIIADDPNTDIILTAIYLQVPYLSEYLPERLIDLQRDLKKPLIVSPRGFSKHVARSRAYLYSKKFHTYTVPMIKPMSIAIKVWCDYGRSFIPEE
ncbi:acetate--CoA ligase family protein [Desulfosudis oleivorans]|uniref:CoA-binding domain protein n=1 Tax=Desulfosudis oleivorans (strain DSM 6200 / JCM 39069 / Hxd3) TaxID=96561 RepID=A8ZU84_DESOH|nr:acetate--CoA ligase family protein [Desulfosudis oleivorans]ABW66396.1 CoA-binding domain protein [Desulfosudis oleivorans Hxd3]